METIVLGISGPIAAGKTWLSARIQEYLNSLNIPTNCISLDVIRRYILWESEEYPHTVVKKQLAAAFGLSLSESQLKLPRDEFTRLLFSSDVYLDRYRHIASPVLYNEALARIKQGHINIIEWAFLEEEGYATLLTHPCIHVVEAIDTRMERLRNMPDFIPSNLERLKLDCFLPKNVIVKSNTHIPGLLKLIGVTL